MREKMEENTIIRVTEVEITEAAFDEGRSVVRVLDSLSSDSAKARAFISAYPGDIRFLKPGSGTIRLLEQQLIDAYLADTTGSVSDNVQNVRDENGVTDSLLYTKPVIRKLSDGRDELVGVWNIWLSRRELVKGIGRKRAGRD